VTYVRAMRYPELTSRQRMAVAKVSGAAARLSTGRDRDMPRAEALAELRTITWDREVFGHVLGDVLADGEQQGTAEFLTPTVELLRSAGADEDAAAAKLAWRRAEVGKRGEHPDRPTL
jgi:hypothetical protein